MPPIFGSVAITLGIGPHSSFLFVVLSFPVLPSMNGAPKENLRQVPETLHSEFKVHMTLKEWVIQSHEIVKYSNKGFMKESRHDNATIRTCKEQYKKWNFQ